MTGIRTLMASLAVLLLSAAAATPTRAQPPVEDTTIDWIDFGPMDVPACGCVVRPFEFSRFRLDPDRGNGPGMPLRVAGPRAPAPVSRAEHRRLQREFLSLLADARQGNGHASFGVAVAYASGRGVGQDLRLSTRWYITAARQGHPQAATFAGSRIARGVGALQDFEAAAAWFRLGAALGDRTAMTALGLLHAAGRGVAQDPSLAAEWWRRSGDGPALRLLGDAHGCGIGVALDPSRAAALYEEAPAFSAIQLGDLHRLGCGVPGDPAKAAEWYLQDEAEPEAQLALSEMYRLGEGVGADALRAYELAALAAYRLQEGALRDRALGLRDQAARLLSAEDVAATESIVRALIESHLEARGSTPGSD